MFRVVRLRDTGEPAFFLLCDHRQCMEARRGPAVVTNSDDFTLTKKRFLKSAIDEGWWVDLEGAYCPPHAQEMLHAAREAKERSRQIVEPHGPQVAAFGRSR